ncbi:MAG: type I polyketide synthase, partial [Acidimicrobiales bacterium]
MSDLPDQSADLSPLKRAFLAIEDLQARLEAAQHAAREPIAIVGIGCRLPGAVDDCDQLWALLRDKVDAISEVPSDRWDVDAYYDPDFRAPGKISTRYGGFVRNVSGFDAAFFGIAPREADAMDPQQRVLLEVAWEALEHAGQAPADLAGSPTGVFIGVAGGDYAQLTLASQGIDGLGAYYASGIAHSIVSGRLSYVMGLEGPSVSLDTACSSSLVAVHLAIQSLRLGESDLALAGGVNLILSPESSITLSKYQMLSPDGRCKFGDESANGFVRAEGCAVVVLKRLADAQASGDRILAVIRGSAVNQDGASSGLIAPNGPSQEAVMRAALANAGVRSGDVSYVEAHGTGTALGDPIELQALGAVYGAGRDPHHPLIVGSLKSNVGHLEAAAGAASLVKLVMMLQHRSIPASLHFETPSAHVAWDELSVAVPVAEQPWTSGDGRLLGGLSCFGFSGTNVHMVVEEPPPAELRRTESVAADDRPAHVLAVSARSDAALRELAERHAHHLACGVARLDDTAHTLSVGRNHFAHRVAVVADDAPRASRQLAAFANGEPAPEVRHGAHSRTDPPKIAFLFTGQGSQYLGMGRELYRTQPVFRFALDRCAETLDAILERPLLDVLFAPDNLDTTVENT